MPRRNLTWYAGVLGVVWWLLAGPALGANRLAQATSPYLAQHADSPVAWHPWGEEALARAKREKKLIFLSIGYGSCHWCRVMDRESFMDPKTAALLNAHYVSIKVDREERPDLDGHFMNVLTAMTGNGGWPLNMILTPALQPIYGGSYFPLDAGRESVSFKSVLTAVQKEWQGGQEKLLQRMGKLTAWLAGQGTLAPEPEGAGQSDPRSGVATFWQGRFDRAHGGIGGRESKSPQPLIVSLLLRQAARQRENLEGHVALLTLDQMAAGGVRDQLGGAFHRFAVDRRWQVPHFDIMLQDNALLARVYLEAWQLTGLEQYALVVREILEDVLQRLRLPGGCFASALLADGDGTGGYYTWSGEEMVSVLGEAQATPFMELYFDPVEGVVEGRSVLRLLSGLGSLGQSRQELRESRRALLAAREKRSPPVRDDKQLTSWNGLMISALARAGAVLQEESYLDAARTCLAELDRQFPTVASLRHSRRGERVGAEVFLDDYAFLAQGLLDLYEADFDLNHLRRAGELVRAMWDRFQPASGHLLQLTPRDVADAAIPAQTVWEDGSQPAGNSVALVTLQRLLWFTQDAAWEKEAAAMRAGLTGHLEKKAVNMPELLRVWDYHPDAAVEVVVAGARAHPGTQALLRTVRQRLIPGLVVGWVDPGQGVDGKAWPLLAGRALLNGAPTAYVCRNMVCRLPVNRPEDLVRELEGRVP